MPNSLPTPVRERIVLADALRGFALMGLFIVHMVEYFELYWYKPEPGWIHNLIFFLFGGKAYGIFALLFGLSFHIILDNYRQRGVDFRLRFCWRLLLLLGFGYVHSLLYAGDILQLLALCGFLLVATHALPLRYLYLFAAFFLIQIPHITAIIWHTMVTTENYNQPLFLQYMSSNFNMFAHADLTALVQYNVVEGQKGKWLFFLETGRFWNIIGLMFVGAILGRLGIFERKAQNIRLLMVLIIISLLLYALITLLKPSVAASFPEGMAQWSATELMNYYSHLTLISVWIILIMLGFAFSGSRKLLRYFAPTGRMTLSLYVGQSIFFVPLYYGFGLGAYDYLGQLWSLLLGIVLWLLQMVIASWWLNNHRYGPLEWLWRKLTFIGFQTAQNRNAH